MVSGVIIEILSEERILADILAIAQDKGVINEIFEQSRIYIYYSVFARVLGNLFSLYSQYLKSVDIFETTDEALLEILLRPFIQKKMATTSKTILRFRRRDIDNFYHEDVRIPLGTRVSTEDTNPILFRTAEGAILRKNQYEIHVPAYSIEYGYKNNVGKDTLVYFHSDVFSVIEVTNIVPATGGQNEETAFDARSRLHLFRYARDGSIDYVNKLITDQGIIPLNYSISQYYDGGGSLLIALDIDSIYQYYDIIKEIENKLFKGLSVHFCRVSRIYLNLNIDISITGTKMHDSYDVIDIKQKIGEAIEIFFEAKISVGTKLSIKRLEAFIINYLVQNDFEIYELDITVADNNNLVFDNETGEIIMEPYEKLYANKIQTEIHYNRA